MPPDRVGLKYTKSLNREVEGEKYWHHRITGSDLGDLAERLKWEHGDELVAEVRGESIIVRRKK